MSPSLNYAPVHTMRQTYTPSSLCNDNLAIVVITESLMSSVAPSGSTEAHHIGTESHTNLCFTAGIYIATDTLFSLQ